MRIAPEEQFSITRPGWRSSTPSSQARWARLWPSRPSPTLSASRSVPGAGVDVVVELEEADAEAADEAVDHGVEVRDGGRVAQVEVVAVVLDEALAVALEERLVAAACRPWGCGRR